MNLRAKPLPPLDPRDLRKALGRFPTGVVVIATRDEHGRAVGLTCNSFTSVSLSPPLVLWCLALYSPNLPAFLQAAYFSVNFVSADQMALSQQFSSPVAERFEGIAHTDGEGGIPLITGCAAHLECRTETRHYIGDHVIFIGHVLRCAHSDRKALVFSEGQYGGFQPPTA